MEKRLLELSVCVEPDRRRLARFALDAVVALGGSPFRATARFDALLHALREAAANVQGGLQVALVAHGRELALCWEEAGGHARRERLDRVPEDPSESSLEALSRRLRRGSESTDPELLRRRNARFAAELERARERAAAEMAELEADLERKKAELQRSIREAETDSLTGLFNRGAFDARLEESLLHCARQDEPLSLVLLDLDFFKQMNDTHGHQFGDDYLRGMADAMRAAIREHVDLPCRTGGDEFAIIVFGDRDAAAGVAQRVLAAMEGRVSIGVGQRADGDAPEQLVARTDAALYLAKHRGRGQVATELELEAPDAPAAAAPGLGVRA